VDVRLRVVGAVPKIGIFEGDTSTVDGVPLLAATWPADYSKELQAQGREGVVVRSSRLVNPAQRPTQVWLSARQEQPLVLRTFVGQQTYHQTWDAAGAASPPILDPVRWTHSTAKLTVSEVEVSRGGRLDQPLRIALSEGEWVGVEMAPLEEISVRWLAKPQASTTLCQVPPTPVRHVFWQDFSKDPLCREQSFGCFGIVAKDLEEPWILGGSELVGEWSVGVAFTNVWEPAPRDSASLVLAKLNRVQGGLPAESNQPAHSCQGIF
jgi:hypothetical protein